MGGRYKGHQPHVLEVILLESSCEALRCVGVLRSPEFTVYSTRRANPTDKVRRRGVSLGGSKQEQVKRIRGDSESGVSLGGNKQEQVKWIRRQESSTSRCALPIGVSSVSQSLSHSCNPKKLRLGGEQSSTDTVNERVGGISLIADAASPTSSSTLPIQVTSVSQSVVYSCNLRNWRLGGEQSNTPRPIPPKGGGVDFIADAVNFAAPGPAFWGLLPPIPQRHASAPTFVSAACI